MSGSVCASGSPSESRSESLSVSPLGYESGSELAYSSESQSVSQSEYELGSPLVC